MAERYELAEGYTISRVINGCWQLSKGHKLKGRIDEDDVLFAFDKMVENGYTTFDCADIYTGAEDLLGEFSDQLKHHSVFSPSDIQIHTKFVPDINVLGKMDFEYVENIIDRSLERQRRDVLDLVQFHWWEYETEGMIETVGFLQDLKKKGKIRNVAVTNYDTENLAKLVDAGMDIISCQTQYSLLDRRPEKGFLDYCKSNGITLLCYGTIAGGFISEKWIGKALPNDLENRSLIKYLQVIDESMGWNRYQQLLVLLKGIADSHQVQIPHVATRYIQQKDGVGATIVGIRNSSHVDSNRSIFSFELSGSDVSLIDNFLKDIPVLEGDPFELERTVGSKFRNIMKMNLNKEDNE